MDHDSDLYLTFAEAHEAAARVFRRKAGLLTERDEGQPEPDTPTALDKVRAEHPQIGTRQSEIVALLDKAGAKGLGTGQIAKAMDYEQPNVYLTLAALVRGGFVEKDTTTSPHTYRLRPEFREDDDHGAS